MDLNTLIDHALSGLSGIDLMDACDACAAQYTNARGQVTIPQVEQALAILRPASMFGLRDEARETLRGLRLPTEPMQAPAAPVQLLPQIETDRIAGAMLREGIKPGAAAWTQYSITDSINQRAITATYEMFVKFDAGDYRPGA